MAIDTRELTILTNPTFARVIGDAIESVYYEQEKAPRLSLSDVLDKKKKPITFKEGDTIANNFWLSCVRFDNLPTNGVVEMDDWNTVTIDYLHRLKDGSILAIDYHGFSGRKGKSLEPNDWVPIDLFGTVLGNGIKLNDETIALLKPVQDQDFINRRLANEQSVKSTLEGAFSLLKLPNISRLGRDERKYKVAKTEYVQFMSRRWSEMLGGKHEIFIPDLIPGVAIAHNKKVGEVLVINYLVFNGLTEVIEGSLDRFASFTAVDEIRISNLPVLVMGNKKVAVSLRDSDLRMGLGDVYPDFNTMKLKYESIAMANRAVDDAIKLILQRHLGITLK